MKVASLLICDVIVDLNLFKDENVNDTSILVFLPGYFEIIQFIECIYENYERTWIKSKLDLIPLHSSLSE